MITHNSFKLVIEEKNSEAQRLRNELHNTKLKLEQFERERKEVFNEFFGRPVSCIHVKGNGHVEVRTKNGENLIFKVELIGEAIQCET